MLRNLKMKKKKGFTLIELIVVIVILAVLAVVGLNAMNGFIQRANRARVLANGRAVYLAAMTVGADHIAAKGGAPLTTATELAATEDEIEAVLGANSGIAVNGMANVKLLADGTVDDTSASTFKYVEDVGTIRFTVTKTGPGFTIAEGAVT